MILFGIFVEYDWSLDTRYDKTGLKNPSKDAKIPHTERQGHEELYGSKWKWKKKKLKADHLYPNPTPSMGPECFASSGSRETLPPPTLLSQLILYREIQEVRYLCPLPPNLWYQTYCFVSNISTMSWESLHYPVVVFVVCTFATCRMHAGVTGWLGCLGEVLPPGLVTYWR